MQVAIVKTAHKHCIQAPDRQRLPSLAKRLLRAAAIGRGGGGQLALPTTALLSLMSVIWVACPAAENCHRGDLGVHGNVVSSFGNCLTNL
jgi:hypothetical protein